MTACRCAFCPSAPEYVVADVPSCAEHVQFCLLALLGPARAGFDDLRVQLENLEQLGGEPVEAR